MSQEEDTAEFLEHFGVKGMQWGVRRENRLQRVQRVASGTASKADKARVALTEVSGASLARNKGLRGAAASRASQLEVRKERIQKGEAKVRDLIALHGGDRLIITGRPAKA